MFNLKYKICHLGSKKGEIVTLLTLGLVVIGAIITIGSSFFVNKKKNIASNPRASMPCEVNQSHCLLECGSYSLCSSSCAKQYNVPDEGTADRICISGPTSTPKPVVPTNTPPIPTSSSDGCFYPNSRECQDDCSGSCSICTGGRYKCVTKIVIPTPTKSSTSNCPYTCEKYECSSGYIHVTNYSCSGFDTVCCQKGSVVPTKIPTSTPRPVVPTNTPPIPTSSSDGCFYPNSRECQDDCSGSCSICTGGRYKCVTKIVIPTPTKSVNDLFNKDCRCINGFWSGDGCDGWQRGKSCLPAGLSQCKQNSQRCNNASDTSCCSGYCVPSPYGYYCQSAADVAKGCTSLTIKCDGNYLMKCVNGAWVKEKLCGSCQTTLLGVKCVETDTRGAVQTSSTINGSFCTTRDGWPGTCTLSSNCNSIKSGIAWDNNVTVCQSSGPPYYGCCGIKPNDDCFQKGSVQVKGEKCFACYLTDKTPGKMIEVSSSSCQKIALGQITSMNPAEIQLNAASTEDQYRLRQNAFDNYESLHNVPVGEKAAAWLMEQADSLTYYTFGQLPKLFGGKAESSMGNYYVAQYQAGVAAEAAGITRKVTVGQALTTGVIGGYQYANNMLLLGLPDGALNLVTGGRTRNWEANILTTLYGANEAAAAAKTIPGSDITNIVAILVPVGKGLSAAGGKMTTTATRLEQAGQTGVRSALLRGGGRITSVAGEGFQIISPETWAAGFIKSAPVTTFLEQSAVNLGRLRPVVAASTRVTEVAGSLTGKLATTFPRTFEVISTAGKTTKTIGTKVVDLFLPRSALTYTPEEAAKYLVRDLDLGIVQPDDVVNRLAARYRQSFVNSNQINNFVNKLEDTGIDEKLIPQIKNNIIIDLQQKLAERAVKQTVGDRLVSFFKPDADEIKVISDLHSDWSNAQIRLAAAGFIDPATGKAKNIVGVILGDYFGKTTTELVEYSTTPGYDLLRNAIDLQEQTGGKIVALAGNWEPRTAYAIRLQKLSQAVEEAVSRGDETYLRALLKDNGFKDAQALNDEIRNFLKLDTKGPMALSQAEIVSLANKNKEVGALMGKLKIITRMPDGSVFQHVDDAELLRYIFNSVEEIDGLALSPESKAALQEIFSSRGNGKTYLTADQVREINLAAKQLGLSSDALMEKINQNTAKILEDGLTQLNDPLAKTNLLNLERDMSKDLAFYNSPDVLVEYSNIFSQNGDFRLATGHSPIDTIANLLGNGNQESSQFVRLADGVYILKDSPNISIYGTDVRLSEGMRVNNPITLQNPNGFLKVLNGLMQVNSDTVKSDILSGPIRVVTNPYDPAYLILSKVRNLWLLNKQ